ncbi:MAG: SRPBCC family protein [Myxococcales bacterium]|nr:SRPBCC family protein [Myxococcales bacterium]
MAEATHSVVIEAPPEAVYGLVTDFESYPSFVPNQVGARIVSAEGEHAWQVEFELSVAKKLRYTLDLKGDPGRSVRWTLVAGDMMEQNVGGWTLEALPGGKTRATYAIDVKLRGFVPRSISRALIERTLPANLDAFKREAERRQGG